MNINTKVVAALMRQLIDLIDAIDEASAGQVLRRQLKLALVDGTTGKRPSQSELQLGIAVSPAEIREKLKNIETRERAESYLDEVSPRRVDLVQVARYLAIPIHNSDTVK